MFPPGTGLLVKAGSKIVLQVHYNLQSLSSDSQVRDLSQVEFALADQVERRAFVLPWTNPQWVSKQKMPIPAGAQNVDHSFGYDPTQYVGVVSGGQFDGSSGFRIHNVSLHQHLLGKTSNLTIAHPDGSSTCLLDIPRWDFHWQRGYDLAHRTALFPGDLLNIDCTWDNSAENQPLINGQRQAPRDVNWGENTSDEMCLGILYISN
jgi:hypothetical protein